MNTCVIFGGAGFVGTHLAKYFLENGIFSRVHLADIRESPIAGLTGITTSITDVRNEIDLTFGNDEVDWIFNLAAIHREPGHEPSEYFETNIKGAQFICKFSDRVKCNNIFFTSSISVYGPCFDATDESKLPTPITPYGGSKYPAELIHQMWLNVSSQRRLIIVRPGVIYGPGDPGNILRMIKAIKKGYFVFPGSKQIRKSYAYIYGFIDSVNFTMNKSDRLIIYNYVETPTDSIEQIANIVKVKLKSRSPIISIPSHFLLPVAWLFMRLGSKNGIHPVRVKKAGTPTHIVPQRLINMGFTFNYNFEKSIDHWMKVSPGDFL